MVHECGKFRKRRKDGFILKLSYHVLNCDGDFGSRRINRIVTRTVTIELGVSEPPVDVILWGMRQHTMHNINDSATAISEFVDRRKNDFVTNLLGKFDVSFCPIPFVANGFEHADLLGRQSHSV